MACLKHIYGVSKTHLGRVKHKRVCELGWFHAVALYPIFQTRLFESHRKCVLGTMSMCFRHAVNVFRTRCKCVFGTLNTYSINTTSEFQTETCFHRFSPDMRHIIHRNRCFKAHRGTVCSQKARARAACMFHVRVMKGIDRFKSVFNDADDF